LSSLTLFLIGEEKVLLVACFSLPFFACRYLVYVEAKEWKTSGSYKSCCWLCRCVNVFSWLFHETTAWFCLY